MVVMDWQGDLPCSAMPLSPLTGSPPLSAGLPAVGLVSHFSLTQALHVFFRDSQMYFYLLSPKTQGLRQPLEETC